MRKSIDPIITRTSTQAEIYRLYHIIDEELQSRSETAATVRAQKTNKYSYITRREESRNATSGGESEDNKDQRDRATAIIKSQLRMRTQSDPNS